MNFHIHITSSEQGFCATPLGLPVGSVEAGTREEAIAKARLAIAEFLWNEDVIPVDIASREEARKRGAGIFADVPEEEWQAYLAAIQEYRRQVDAEESISEAA